MQVAIQLDHPNRPVTNLDVLSGKVVLRCLGRGVDINAVVVKLEGESLTRLAAPPMDGRRPKPMIETHKVLYKVQTVFPTAELLGLAGQWNPYQDASVSGPRYVFPLVPGAYEYPFSFKIPFNNICSRTGTFSGTSVGFGSLFENHVTPTEHVKKTLPPSLTGFPGEAEIRYFVKVTIQRPGLLTENFRAFVPFNFLPIEPPRPPKSGAEIYARRQFEFEAKHLTPFARKNSLFGKSTESVQSIQSESTPKISVDMRLPSPAILTCNKDIPIRLLIKKLSPFPQQIFLQSLQIDLIGTTHIRSYNIVHKETTSWVVHSVANIGMTVGSPSDPVDKETLLSRELTFGRPLPNTVCPSFHTCNLRRTYELEVRVGVSCGNSSKESTPTVFLPLRLPVEVYSGIAPPAELLARMTHDPTSIPTDSNSGAKPTSNLQNQPPGVRPQRMPGTYPSNSAAGPDAPAPPYDDAPPSYEDAVAQDMPPVDGPRANYQPPFIERGASGFPEEKGS